jgi:hypothetical protein
MEFLNTCFIIVFEIDMQIHLTIGSVSLTSSSCIDKAEICSVVAYLSGGFEYKKSGEKRFHKKELKI